MARKPTTRVRLRRKMKQAAGNCDSIANYFAEIASNYPEDTYPVKRAIESAYELLAVLKDLILTIRSNM